MRISRRTTGALLAGALALGGLSTSAALTAAPAHAASAPATPIWSTQLDFDNGGAAWSEPYFAALAAKGLTTAELNMPWGTIEPSAGTFSFTIWDQELANAAAAGIQLIPVFWQSGWDGSPAPWITDLEKTSTGAAGVAPDWWNTTEQAQYFTYVENTIQNSIAQPGGYGGAVLDYGFLDAQWDISGSGGGYAGGDITEFQNVYLPNTFGTIAAFNAAEGTSYTSFNQVPAQASGQPLFGVFQAFRAWSVEQTYGALTAAVRKITANTPLYYYYGGSYGNVTNYANNPDSFFKLAKQYNVTVIADSASNTGMTLAMTSLGRAYGVKVAEEWTAPNSDSELAAYAVQWLDSYGMTFPQAGGEDFFIHDGTSKDTVGYPIYTSWLPTLKSLSGTYPQQSDRAVHRRLAGLRQHQRRQPEHRGEPGGGHLEQLPVRTGGRHQPRGGERSGGPVLVQRRAAAQRGRCESDLVQERRRRPADIRSAADPAGERLRGDRRALCRRRADRAGPGGQSHQCLADLGGHHHRDRLQRADRDQPGRARLELGQLLRRQRRRDSTPPDRPGERTDLREREPRRGEPGRVDRQGRVGVRGDCLVRLSDHVHRSHVGERHRRPVRRRVDLPGCRRDEPGF